MDVKVLHQADADNALVNKNLQPAHAVVLAALLKVRVARPGGWLARAALAGWQTGDGWRRCWCPVLFFCLVRGGGDFRW